MVSKFTMTSYSVHFLYTKVFYRQKLICMHILMFNSFMYLFCSLNVFSLESKRFNKKKKTTPGDSSTFYCIMKYQTIYVTT